MNAAMRMKDRLTPLILLAVLFAGLAAVAVKTHPGDVRYDGVFYFIQLRSAYVDRDIDYRNEMERYPWVPKSYPWFRVLPSGKIACPYAIGSAMLWSPFYAVGDVYCHLRTSLFHKSYQCDGYSLIYVKSVVIGTCFWIAAGMVLIIYALKRLRGRLSLALISALVLALTSPLIFYPLLQADYAHGNSFFAVSLLLYMTLVTQDHGERLSYHFLCGLCVGLAFLVRWQDVATGVLPLAFIVLARDGGKATTGFRARMLRLTALGCGAFLAALPQLMYWSIIYGAPVIVPQGDGYFTLQNIQPLNFFISTWNGAFVFHPIYLLALIGLLGVPSKFFAGWDHDARVLRSASVVVVGVGIFFTMMTSDWWGGGSFGQRRLIAMLPVLALGLYHLLSLVVSARRRGLTLVATAFVVAVLLAGNGLLLLRHYQGKMPYNPGDASWYQSGVTYGQHDYVQRFSDILMGRKP